MTTPTITFLTRAQWRAAPPRHDRLQVRTSTLRGATFHHTTGANLGSRDTATWARSIQQFCFGRGYGDIEYNAMIRAYIHPVTRQPRGVFVEGRDPKWVGAHASSTGNTANRETVGVALMGDSRDVLANPRLIPVVKALLGLSWYLVLLDAHAHGVADPKSFGHRDWIASGGIATFCPGDAFLAMIHALDG